MLKPLNTYLLVQYEQPTEQKTTGGLYVPPTITNLPNDFLKSGRVVEVNAKCEHIKKDDIVYFNKNAMVVVPNEPDLRLVREEDLYLIQN